jgi:hypothetical protein
MAVSQFMRHMSAAKWVVIEAAIHRDTGYARRVNTRAAHVTDAEVADMTTTNDSAADGPHVSSAEATDMTAAKLPPPRARTALLGIAMPIITAAVIARILL